MAEQRVNVHIPSHPPVLDSVQLQDIQLSLPAGPDPWHRLSKPQPCTASLKLSYSSAVAAAAADDVSLSLDYGKLFRRLDHDIQHMWSHRNSQALSADGSRRNGVGNESVGQDVRTIAEIVANSGLGLLDETVAGVRRMSHVHQSPRSSFSAGSLARTQLPTQAQTTSTTYGSAETIPPIDGYFGRCEVWLHLPKALLRAEDGLKYRSVTVWGYRQPDEAAGEEEENNTGRCPVVLEEEFQIGGIRCYCILGVNSHERVEKQGVIVSLEFKGPGQLAWSSTVVDTYQDMTRTVAERVGGTSFQTVEALATFIARIVTVEFANERVTVRVQKPSALAFVGLSGVEVTRSQSFFDRPEVGDRTYA